MNNWKIKTELEIIVDVANATPIRYLNVPMMVLICALGIQCLTYLKALKLFAFEKRLGDLGSYN